MPDRSRGTIPRCLFQTLWVRFKACPTKVRQLHSDESGVISLLTVFIMLGCTWLLLWVLNSAKQLDSKVRLQNAADTAGQSGVAILARGMNAIAFANQLEADLFAAVAVMQAAPETPAASSPLVDMLLPVFQEILAGQSGQLPSQRPIPAFRSDIVRRIPSLADEVTRTVSRANGLWRGPIAANAPDGPQGPLFVQLWSTSGRPIGQGSEDDPYSRTLPVLDASPSGPDARFLANPDQELDRARQEREQLVKHYLRPWALDVAGGDQTVADLLILRAQRRLGLLLDDLYRDSNLPLVLRSSSTGRRELERDVMYVSVAYRLHPRATAAVMFRNPNASQAPAMALGQVQLFLPRQRYVCCPWTETHMDPRTGEPHTVVFTDGWPGEWSASTQNWQAKLVPATAPALSEILSSSLPNGNLNQPGWGQLTPRQLDELTHQ